MSARRRATRPRRQGAGCTTERLHAVGVNLTLARRSRISPRSMTRRESKGKNWHVVTGVVHLFVHWKRTPHGRRRPAPGPLHARQGDGRVMAGRCSDGAAVTTQAEGWGRVALGRKAASNEMLPADHLSFPNPDSAAARLVAEERRREPPSVEYRVTWSEEQMRRAQLAPGPPHLEQEGPAARHHEDLRLARDVAILCEDVRRILETAPPPAQAAQRSGTGRQGHRPVSGPCRSTAYHPRLSQLARAPRRGGSGAASGGDHQEAGHTQTRAAPPSAGVLCRGEAEHLASRAGGFDCGE